MMTFLLCDSLLLSHLHVCTPAHPHRWRTAPLHMDTDSEWSASDEVSTPTRSTRSKALPLRLPPATRPSFAPTQASLRNAIERATTPRVGSPQSVLQGLDSAYVLIFNAGQQDESVHTELPKYVPFNTVQANSFVLAFELNDDAGRFALQLQAEGFVSHRP
jgi:hypothetical protein